MRAADCPNCAEPLAVARCPECSEEFVVTVANRERRLREFDDPPLQLTEIDFEVGWCDFCTSKAADNDPVSTTNVGLRQGSCPHCHTAFLW